MLSDERLLLSLRQMARVGQRGPVLLLLSQLSQPAETRQIKEKGVQIGFRDVEKWNLTDILKKAASDQQVAQLSNGWKLLEPGYKVIEAYYKPEAAIIQEARHALRLHLQKIADDQRKSFIQEAIWAFDVKAYRAAIVFPGSAPSISFRNTLLLGIFRLSMLPDRRVQQKLRRLAANISFIQ
jgi:hypothetical protein